ncbi:hypothetical protein THAOC_00154 [Thalassiosira oceanica]|uniref:Uncharacterized protein n=1 Tax=Thalassiosira oceanica TaxID=159749 RepID=K3W4I0_THAOC|nr:hypothetical protein THAOC_00154 [Thalassiosira oceanica]|eukprot:EJK77974.1 hypothetical protein THAOC_00154 [Thalassiosira oceanica]
MSRQNRGKDGLRRREANRRGHLHNSVPANYRPGDRGPNESNETFEGDDVIRANSTPVQSNHDQPDEPMDALAMHLQQFCHDNNIEEVEFDPDIKVLNPNSVLKVTPQPDDDISVLTPMTAWGDEMTVSSKSVRQQPQNPPMSAISEARPSSTSGGASITSHEIKEPQPQSEDQLTYLSSDMSALREVVDVFLSTEEVEEAIGCLTQALITDNAHSKDVNLAWFCLTKLLDLARESDVKKKAIIFVPYTLDAIIEAMKLYNELSCEIERTGCGLLWSLGMMVDNRPLITQKGGIEAILNAQLCHMEDLQLQIMAMGALKVLTFDSKAKDVMRRKYGTDVVADIMNEHTFDATIQVDGCVIIGNCAVDDGVNYTHEVSEREIEAVLAGMVAHEGLLVVAEAALFTLMSLAHSKSNATVIQQNQLSKIAMDKAFKQHPNELAMTILTLIKRLKLNTEALRGTETPWRK